MLRHYQQRSVEAIMAWVRKCVDPALIEAATGAGKSHVIAEVASQIQSLSGKSVLCLAPSAELVHQNRAKYLATGNPASIYSASAGKKCLKHPVVFATPGTAGKATGRLGASCAAVVVDEAHHITNTVRRIISELREANPNLRVIGLTATPYRLDSGYIFQAWPDGASVEQANEPYFARLVDRITAHELIEQGYLTPPRIGDTDEAYDTSALELSKTGAFTAASQERAYEGQGRKTSRIVADIVERSRDRQGVLIFAATRQHAHEVLESLPPDRSALIDGTTRNRRQLLDQFQRGHIKYLVNVQVLTTGFDAEHIDVIAMLRHTESAGLMQQMIGRGLRIHRDKSDCLVLDYADNITTHTPDGDLFNPNIEAPYRSGFGEPIKAQCERCGYVNQFTARKNPDGYDINANGYFVDLDGAPVESDYGGAMPAHYGRRCLGTMIVGGRQERCTYRWTCRICPKCDADNDIAARYCEACKSELVDPNEKLRLDFKRFKADPYQMQTDEVLAWQVRDTLSKSGNPMYKVSYTTPYRTVVAFYLYAHSARKAQRKWERFRVATSNATVMPDSITYYKDPSSGFWEVVAYNEAADKHPDVG